jgi:hypothetical protein
MNKQNGSIKLVLLAILFIASAYTQLSGQLFNVGDKNLNLTIGIGTPWVLYNNYHTVLPPVAASFDYGFRDDLGPGILSIGGMVGATTYRDHRTSINWVNDYGYKSTTAIVALRGTYHYQFIDKLDTYGGIHLGMRFESWKQYGNFPTVYEPKDFDMRPVFSLFGGAKYYFTEQLAAMVEVGYSIAFVNLGVCVKL